MKQSLKNIVYHAAQEHSLMDNLPGVVYRGLNDEQRTMEFIGAGGEELTGYTTEALINNRDIAFASLIHPEDRENAWQQIQTALQKQQAFRCVYRITTKDGTVKWVWERGSGIYTEDGEIQALEGFLEDITELKRPAETQAQSEAPLRMLFESIQDGVFLVQDARLRYVNRALAEMMGYTVEEMLGQDISAFIAPEDRGRVEGYYHRRLAGETVPNKYECRLLHKDSETRVFANMNVVLTDFNGNPASMGTVRDITERRLIESERARLFRRIQQQQDTLIQLSMHTTIAEGDLDKALELVAHLTAEVLGVARVNIWRLTSDGSAYRWTTGYSVINGPEFDGVIINIQDYPRYFAAIDAGLVMDVDDVRQDPRTLELIEGAWNPLGVNALLVAPVRIGGRIEGIIACEHVGTTRSWEADEITFANRVAYLVAQAFLNNDVRRRADELAVITRVSREISSVPDLYLVLTSIARHAAELSNADLSGVFAFTPDGSIMMTGYGTSETFIEQTRTHFRTLREYGVVAEAIRERQPIQAPNVDLHPYIVREHPEFKAWIDSENIKALLTVPIIKADAVVGAIVIGQRQPRKFTAREIAFLQALAQQSLNAIENARFLKAERDSRRRTEALYQVTKSLIDFEGLNERLQIVVDSIAAVLRSDSAMLAILNVEKRQVVRFVVSGPDRGASLHVTFDELWAGLTGWVMREGKVAFSPKHRDDPRESNAVQKRRKDDGAGSILVVPLRYGENTFGTLTAVNYMDKPDFTDEDAALMTAMANQAAAAIENVRLFESLTEEKARLELLYRLSRYLSESLNVHDVAKRALNEITKLFDNRQGNVVLSVPGSDTMTMVAAVGYPENDVHVINRQFSSTYRAGLSGWVAKNRESCLVPNTSEDERWLVLEGFDNHVRAALAVPLVSSENLIGVMMLTSTEANFFNESHLRLTESAATTVAIAIANAHLFDAARRNAQEQAWVSEIARALNALDIQGAYPVLVDRLEDLTGANHISLARLNTGENAFDLEVLKTSVAALGKPARFDIAELVAGKRILAGRAHFAADLAEERDLLGAGTAYEAGLRSSVTLPLLVGGRVIGILYLGSEQVGKFNKGQLTILQQVADSLASALENNRLFQAERQQRELAERLRETSLMVSSLNREEVLELILDQLAKVIPYDSGSIQILERVPEPAMRVIAERNLEPDTLDRSYPLDEFPYNRRLANGEGPIVIRDVRGGEHGWVAFDDVDHVQSNIGVPLWVRERVIGALTIDSSSTGTYTERDARVVQAFAQQAAIALENARLFEAERAQRELAEALREAASIVSSSLDADEVLDHILEQAARVVAGDTFNVMLIEGDMARVVRRRGYEQFGIPGQIEGFSIAVKSYPSLQKMVNEGAPVIIEDTLKHESWVKSQTEEWRRSYVAAPIRIFGKPVGFVNVNGIHPNQFTADDAHRLQAFADHAALAIQNARAFQQQQRHAEELEQRVKERTAQLEAQFARSEAILRSTLDGIIVSDAKGDIIEANPVAERWLTQTLVPEDAEQLRETVRDLTLRALEAQENNRTWRREDTVLELKGLDLQIHSAPISEQGLGEAAAIIGAHDVSHLKALDRVKSRFVSNVSHELRTPITSVRLYVALLQRTATHKQQTYLEALEQEAQRLAKQVEDILQLSRVDAGRLEIKAESVNLKKLIETAVAGHSFLAESRELDLRYESETQEETWAFIDKDQFSHVVNNLIENAIRYTDPGGHIIVSTGKQQAEGRQWAILRVKDTGIGISEEEQEHIFERFYRGDEPRKMQIPGSGLGLAIVKDIVELHGGRITVDSQLDMGSVFTVLIPLANQR